MQAGFTRKPFGAAGPRRLYVLQQICPVQSVFSLHDLGHVLAQTPLQQSWLVEAQSCEVWQLLGHASKAGFKHTPGTLSEGSRVAADVQQISPVPVLHSELWLQPLGQRLAGMQMAWL
jgi:hypothetical protein